MVRAKGDGRFAGQETWKQLQGRDRIKDGDHMHKQPLGWENRQKQQRGWGWGGGGGSAVGVVRGKGRELREDKV